MKNNQKEIDMIVEEVNKVIENFREKAINVIWGSALDTEFKSDNEELRNKISVIQGGFNNEDAALILTKLKENEIVLAKGKVKDIKKDCEFKIGNKILTLGIYPDWIGLELRKVEGKKVKIILEEE